MPVYRFQCASCKAEFEVRMSFRQFELLNDCCILCTVCGSGDIRRKYSVTPIFYRGTGWTKKVEDDAKSSS